MIGPYLELVFIVLIIAGVALASFLSWRGGSANPVGTRTIERDMTSLSNRVGKIDTTLKALGEQAASKSSVDEVKIALENERKKIDVIYGKIDGITEDLVEMREASAKRSELTLREIGKLGAQTARTDARVDGMAAQIGLIYQVVVPKGMQ
ncbi:hypothetical protein AAG607_13690 [Citromicrobium bathyomarinum]|uniref:hypothetical protein n=1 Tax=Citromicrobium bathyomarinum TaxID=72174 RepID=UPI00315A010B